MCSSPLLRAKWVIPSVENLVAGVGERLKNPLMTLRLRMQESTEIGETASPPAIDSRAKVLERSNK